MRTGPATTRPPGAGEVEEAVALVADRVIPADLLITRVVPLVEARAAFDALETAQEVMKVLVDCARTGAGS